jgi:hypothetical protein
MVEEAKEYIPCVKPMRVEVALAVVPPKVVVVQGKAKPEPPQALPEAWTTPPEVTWRQLVEELPSPLILSAVVEA